MRTCWTYILTNRHRTVLYVGVTNDLARRCLEHRNATHRSFTGRYGVHQLVYYEEFPRPMLAIRRERQLKAGSRGRKVRLIEEANPEWRDLFDPRTAVVSPLPGKVGDCFGRFAASQ